MRTGFSTLLDFVRAGYGAMPISVSRGDEQRGHYTLRRIVEPELVSTIAIATHSERPLPPLTKGVIDLIKQIAAAPHRL